MKVVGALVLLLALTACSGTPGDDEPATSTASSGTTPAPRTEAPPSTPSEDGRTIELATTDVCDLVRRGIDQFNLGDLEATIAAFEDALAPAERLAADQPSDQTRTLLEAVRYYAELPAGDYVEANASSPEFSQYKDFTLTECAYTGLPPDATTDPPIPA